MPEESSPPNLILNRANLFFDIRSDLFHPKSLLCLLKIERRRRAHFHRPNEVNLGQATVE